MRHGCGPTSGPPSSARHGPIEVAPMGQVALLSDNENIPDPSRAHMPPQIPCGGQPSPAREIFPVLTCEQKYAPGKTASVSVKRQRHLFIGMLSVCQAVEAISLSESGSLTAVSSSRTGFPAAFAGRSLALLPAKLRPDGGQTRPGADPRAAALRRIDAISRQRGQHLATVAREDADHQPPSPRRAQAGARSARTPRGRAAGLAAADELRRYARVCLPYSLRT
jgi:hypothetical protein